MKNIEEAFLNLGLLFLRVMMGAGMAYHGYGKIFEGKMEGFTAGVAKLGFSNPEIFAWAAALSEFAGGILVVLGLFTRTAALFIFCTMSVAAFISHATDPLKVKELALAYWTMSGCLILAGGGLISMDGMIFGGKKK